MQLTVDDAVAVNDAVVFKEIDGEAVLLNLECGTYFGLDGLATRVWQAIVEHGRARPALAPLLDEFEVVADVLERDVTQLLSELSATDLIRRR